MKIHVSLLALLSLLVWGSVAAQPLIAVDGPNHHAVFPTLDEAITFAESGDRITLPVGVFAVSSNITKRLEIIGVGHDPRMSVSGGISRISNSFTLDEGSEGSRIEGVMLADVTVNGLSSPITVVDRCNLNYLLANSTTYVVRSVIRARVDAATSISGCLVSNCIVFDHVGGGYASTFRNNVFLNGNGNPAVSYSYSPTIEKNIFLEPTDVYWNQLFENPLVNSNFFVDADWGCSVTCGNLQAFNNHFGQTQDSLFVSTPFALEPGAWNHGHEFVLRENSPARMGTVDEYDDAGIYGGDYPWVAGSLPAIPRVTRNFSAMGATGATYQVNMEVEARND